LQLIRGIEAGILTDSRSTVYVEAELEMRSGGNATDGTPLPDRPLLRHREYGLREWWIAIRVAYPPVACLFRSLRSLSRLLTPAEKMNVINRVKPEVDVEAEGGPELETSE
jgi:hypothetical protein